MATQHRKSTTPLWRAGIFCCVMAVFATACSPSPQQAQQSASASLSSSASVSVSSLSVSSSSSESSSMSSASSAASATSSASSKPGASSRSSSRSVSSSSQGSVASSQSSHPVDAPAAPHENAAVASQSSSVSSIPAKVAAPVETASNAASLDLDSLEQRLRETKAIGVFTKLSLKNQVDDLLNDFRTFYRGKSKLVLTDLRQRYDLLVMKILTLLQDSDSRLAADIRSSREAIWDILQDPEKFSKIS